MIDDKTMGTILGLCRFHLNEEEKSSFRREIGDILSYVEMLESVDTKNTVIAPLEGQKSEQLRADEFRPGLSNKLVAELSGHFEDGLFVVPKILEELDEKKDKS